MKPRSRFTRALPLVTAIFLTPAIGQAATYTWDGGGADDNWATGLNWDTNTVPVSSDTTDLIFTGIDGVIPYSPYITSNWTVKSLTFASFAGANPFTLNGGYTIILGTGGITNNDANTQTFNNGLSIGAGITSSVNGTAGAIVLNNPVALGSSATVLNLTGNVTLNNSISGTGTVNSSGTSNLAGVGGARSYDLVVGGGTLNLAHSGTATVDSSGSISVNSGTLNINGDLVLDNAQLTRANLLNLHIMAGKTLTVKNSADAVITGAFTHDSGTIALQGVGSTLSTTNYLAIQEGATINVSAGASLTPSSYMDVGVAGAAATLLVDAASVTLASPSTSSYWGAGAGTGNVTFKNAATGTVGDIDIAQGTNAGTTANVSIESGATLQTGTLTLATGVGATTATVTVTGVASSITQSGASILMIGAGSLSTANLNLASSGVFTTGSGAIGLNKTGHINLSGGTLNANGNMVIEGHLAHVSGGFNLAAGKTLTVQNGGAATFTGLFTLANHLSVTGASSVLSATGSLSLNNNTVTVGSGGRIYSDAGLKVGVGTGNSIVNVDGAGSSFGLTGGGTLDLGDSTYSGTLNFTNNATGSLGLVSTALGLGGSSAALNIQSGADVTTANILANSGAATTTSILVSGAGSTLVQSGASLLTLGGASNSTATLTVSNSGQFTSGTGYTTIYNTGALHINGGIFSAKGNLYVNGGQLTRDATGTFNLASGNVFSVMNGGDAVFNSDQLFNASHAINVFDSGSTLSTTAGLGLSGGTITNVTAGGSISSGYFWIGAGGNGTATVDGSGSAFNATSAAIVSAIGDSGGTGSLTYRNNSSGTLHGLSLAFTSSAGSVGSLLVQSGADVTLDTLFLAPMASATTATATVTGTGSTLTQNGSSQMTIGATGASSGTLTVSSNGIFTSGTGLTTVEATGIINVTGGTYNANGDISLSGRLNRDSTGIFNLASGKTLTIKNGGDAVMTGSFIHSGGTITLQDSGSTLSSTSHMQINSGCTMNVTHGASLTSGSYLDLAPGGVGAATLLVDAASVTAIMSSYWGFSGCTGNATFRNGATGSVGELYLGYGSTAGSAGNVLIESGGSLQTGNLLLASSVGNVTGSVTATGAGSALTQTGASSLTIGASSASTATLTVASGATFTSGTGYTTIHNTGALHINGGIFSANGNLYVNGGQLTRDATGTFNLASGNVFSVMNGGDAVFNGTQLFNASHAIGVFDSGSTLSTTAGLGLSGGTITNVTAGGSISSGYFWIGAGGNGTATVDGSGSAFNATSAAIVSALGDSGGTGSLTYRNNSSGTLHGLGLAFTSSAGTVGSLSVQSGADVTADTIWMAPMASATTANITVTGVGATLTQNGAAAMVIGAASASSATLTVSNGGTYTSGTGDISLNATGSLIIDAGSVNLRGHLASNGGTLNFTSGSLGIVDDFTVGVGGLLGVAPVFTSTYQFSTTGTTTIDPFKTLTINGGRFGTGSLVNNGGTLNFSGGTLAITGASGMTVGGGSLVALDSDSTLEVTNTLTVQSGGNMVLDGGTINAGTLANQAGGRVSLRSGTGRIIGTGTVANSGVLTGDGIITAAVTNNASGELLAEAGKTLVLTGTNGANAGQITLEGGRLVFSQSLTNSASGVVQGHGAIRFNGGFTNQGAMDFSGNSTDLYGNISMTGASAKLISSGGGTVTVYNNFDHHGAEVLTSPGCSTTFFGAVTGPGSYTGAGTVYYEGSFSPGASPAAVTFGGSVVCGSNLTTYMELGGLARGSQYDIIQVIDKLALSGTLSVSLINGFVPSANNSFDLFDWGTRTGTFSSINLPDLTAGLIWDTSDLYTTGTLEVISATPPAPSNLTATPQPGLSLRLEWQDTSPPAAGFEVQRALDSGFTSGLTTVTLPAGQTIYQDLERTPETTFHYRVRALGSPVPSGFSIPVQATTPTRLADWRWVHFGNQNPVGDGADNQDPDHDGAVNLLEYACNLDPNVADATTLPTSGTAGLPSTTIAPDGHLRITFLRRSDASLPTITQEVVFSNSLSAWSPEPTASVTVETIDPLWDRVTLTDPAAPAARRFASVAVTAP